MYVFTLSINAKNNAQSEVNLQYNKTTFILQNALQHFMDNI